MGGGERWSGPRFSQRRRRLGLSGWRAQEKSLNKEQRLVGGRNCRETQVEQNSRWEGRQSSHTLFPHTLLSLWLDAYKEIWEILEQGWGRMKMVSGEWGFYSNSSIPFTQESIISTHLFYVLVKLATHIYNMLSESIVTHYISTQYLLLNFQNVDTFPTLSPPKAWVP